MSSEDDIATRKRRLAYRARHRGLKEMDLILGRFAERHLGEMDGSALDRFEMILELPDQTLYLWVAGGEPAPPEFDNDVMAALRAFRFTPADFS